MNNRSSASARILAVAALVVALVVAIAAIGGALGGGDSEDGSGQGQDRPASGNGPAKRDVPATYVIKSGDTLLGIAHRMGIPVAQIEELNPEVDPQILVAGEELKLRETR